MNRPSEDVFDALFRPRQVALVGASATPGKLGHTVLGNLIAGGYAGAIWPVNPSATSILGLDSYRAIEALPGPADCAFLAIPAAAVIDSVRACAQVGVRVVIIGAAGFAELGTEEGLVRERELARIARESGMRLLGPNTNGIMSVSDRLSLGYNVAHAEQFALAPISILSHSGALFDGIARRLRDLGSGFSRFVPVGNETDLNMLDLFEHLVDDEATRVIGLVLEALSDGARFRQLAERARARGQSVVALKIGRSARGVEATLAHSSRLAGSERAYNALMRAAGVGMVTSVETLAGACAMLAGTSGPSGGSDASGTAGTAARDRRLVCVTTSGAGGAILADYASERGLPLAGDADGRWSAPVAAFIDTLPTMAAIRNPIDLGSIGDWGLLGQVLGRCGDHGFVGPTVCYAHMGPVPGMGEQLADALVARRAAQVAPVLVLAPGGLSTAVEARCQAGGVMVFRDTTTCFDSLTCFDALRGGAALNTESSTHKAEAGLPEVLLSELSSVSATTIDSAKRSAEPSRQEVFLSEWDSAAALGAAGLPMVSSHTVRTLQKALHAATAIGYPVVLKALAPGVAHKHRAGLVMPALADELALMQAFSGIEIRLDALGHEAGAVDFLVQPMIAASVEVIAGISREDPLGLFLLFGMGGVHAEALDRVELVALPASRERIAERVYQSDLARIVRSVEPEHHELMLERIAHTLDALQSYALAHAARLRSVEINPLRVGPHSCIAVDALIVLDRHTEHDHG